MNNNILISKHTSKLVEELIQEDWKVLLHYGSHRFNGTKDITCWKCTFMKVGEDSVWRNIKSGHDTVLNEAIRKAYFNVKNNIKEEIIKQKI
jgi:hypothetical protein